MEFKICTFYLIVCCFALSSATFNPSRHDKSHSIRNFIDDKNGDNVDDNDDDDNCDDCNTNNIIYSHVDFQESEQLLKEQKEILMREGAKIKRNAERLREKARPTRRDGEELETNTKPATIKNKMKTKKSDGSTGRRRPAS